MYINTQENNQAIALKCAVYPRQIRTAQNVRITPTEECSSSILLRVRILVCSFLFFWVEGGFFFFLFFFFLIWFFSSVISRCYLEILGPPLSFSATSTGSSARNSEVTVFGLSSAERFVDLSSSLSSLSENVEDGV